MTAFAPPPRNISLKHFIHVVAAALLFATPFEVISTEWPSRLVRIYVPVAAGGTADALARSVAQSMREEAQIWGAIVTRLRIRSN